MEPPGQTLVDWALNLQGKLLVDWKWALQEKQLLLSEARNRAAGGGEVERRRLDWRGGAVVDAGAEVILPDLAEIGLLIYPGAGSP